MADWNAIKTEYITTDTSYRKLAQKHGVNVTNIAKRAKAEDWVGQRKQYAIETQTKTVEAVAAQEVDRAARILTVADKLLNKIEAIVDAVDVDMPAKSVRALTAAVKDLKEIQGIRSKLDDQEQEARIAKLRREAEKDTNDDSGVIEVVFDAGPEEWNE